MLEVIVSTFLGLCWASALLGVHKRLSGTTLVGPWGWTVASSIAVVSATILSHTISEQSGSLLRYFAAISTCCPMVAILGAKRPQNRAWQWIVGALWIVLALPAITAITFAHPNLQLGGLWTSLLFILIVLPVGNYLSTRYFFPAILAASAQVFFLVDCGAISLWGAAAVVTKYSVVSSATTGQFLALVSTLIVGYITPHNSHLRSRGTQIADVWYEFSQLYGILWSRHVADRAERIFEQSGIAIGLGRAGFYARMNDGEQQPIPADTLPPEVEATLNHLLLRFVSQNWIKAITSPATQSR
jgi:hypothetical protein